MTTQLTDGLTARGVPINSDGYFIRQDHPSGNPSLSFGVSGDKYLTDVLLPPGQWRIVGTVTDGVPDFDPEPYIEGFYDFDGIKGWYDYPDKKMVWDSKYGSFKSLLTSHSCHTGKWVIVKKVNS